MRKRIADISRRTFLGQAGTTAAAFTIVPRHVLGRGFRAPSDTLHIACIGVNGQGRSDTEGVSGERIVALCDVDWKAATYSFEKFPAATRYRDFREMLEKEKGIDAVTISTPDHTHAVIAMAALQLGKHVYCQKPLARTIGEVRALMARARTTKVATQMGNQGHAQEGTRQIREWVEAGQIGTVREVHYWTDRPIWPQGIERPTEVHHVPATLDWDLWLGPAMARPYHPAYMPFRWRGWWDFGTGALGDIACHAMDAAFWTLDLGFPTRITPDSSALFPETAPRSSRVTYDFPARGGRGPITVVWRDGSLFPPRPPEVPADVAWPPFADGGQLWIGDKGKLVASMYGANPRLLDTQMAEELKVKPLPEKYPRVKNSYVEWIAAAKAGTTGASNFDGHAGMLTQMVLLGNLAVRSGRAVEVDPSTGEIRGAGMVPAYVTPAYREGWGL
jgi:hypothetical protein